MKAKERIFEQLIWDAYSQSYNYDSMRHKLIRIRNIMSKSHNSFGKFPAKQQYDYCITIGIIVVQSTRKDIQKLSIITKEKPEVFEYSIDEGFVKPTPIPLKPTITINDLIEVKKILDNRPIRKTNA
jgi:hypothetical protein